MKNEPLTLRHRIGLEIARKLNNDLLKEHPLKQLFWECTLRCNLHCRHCGSDCKKIAGHPDMPKEDFLKVLDSVAASTDPHKVFVIITGGEPLMREDLEECGRLYMIKDSHGDGDQRTLYDARTFSSFTGIGIAYGNGQP